MVSGSVSSPSRGAFHLSLTVLVHYRLLKVLSLGGWSPLLPTRFHVSRGTQDTNQCDRLDLYWTITISGGAFQRLRVRLSHLLLVLQPRSLSEREREWFGLVPVRSPLLRESRLISSRRATEMFQFTRCLPPRLYIQRGVSRHYPGRVAPFGISGLSARMQLPLNVSPVSASFLSL